MKIIQVPEPVKVQVWEKIAGQAVEVEKEISFSHFLKSVCESYEAFAKGPKNARIYDKIMTKIENLNGEKTVTFDDEHYDLLKSAADSVQWVTPKVNRAYLSFYESLEHPQDA